MIPHPTAVWIFGTNHRSQAKPPPPDHSVAINTALIAPLLPAKCPIHSFYISAQDNLAAVMKRTIDFLRKSKGSVVIFTSDLSHEHNQSSQEVLQKESALVGAILQNDMDGAIEHLKNADATLCGPLNLHLFLLVVKKLKGYTLIKCYDDSLRRRHLWSDQAVPYIVSYLSLTCTLHKTEYLENQFQWQCLMHKAYVLSRLKYGPSIQLPTVYQLNSVNNGVFVTLIDPTPNPHQTRACIGRFHTPNKTLFTNIQDIIPDLKHDAALRWNNPLTEISDAMQCELTVMSNTTTQLSVAEFMRLKQKENGYSLVCPETHQKGTFIPAVWQDNPTWSPTRYLQELVKKAGCNPTSSVTLTTFKSFVI